MQDAAPLGRGLRTPRLERRRAAPYCEWQDVRSGPYGYNGFHFMSIVDFANPAPRNNHFWHYRRKVLMDSFSQHPDRVGTGTGGRVCNSNTNTYYNYRDGNFNTVNMWISGMPNWNPGARRPGRQLPVVHDQLLRRRGRAAALVGGRAPAGADAQQVLHVRDRARRDRLRARGQRQLRPRRPEDAALPPAFVVNNVPIWHYNVNAGEYNGQFNGNLVQNDNNGSTLAQPVAGRVRVSRLVRDRRPLHQRVRGQREPDDVRLYVPRDAAGRQPGAEQAGHRRQPVRRHRGPGQGRQRHRHRRQHRQVVLAAAPPSGCRSTSAPTQNVSRFVVKHAGAGGENTAWNTRDFNIQVSTDGTTWTTVGHRDRQHGQHHHPQHHRRAAPDTCG